MNECSPYMREAITKSYSKHHLMHSKGSINGTLLDIDYWLYFILVCQKPTQIVSIKIQPHIRAGLRQVITAGIESSGLTFV